jgi:hypothetical protein
MAYQAPTTPLEAVTLAIKLAITAPSGEKADRCAEIGSMLVGLFEFTDQELDTAKALALAEIAIEEDAPWRKR